MYFCMMNFIYGQQYAENVPWYTKLNFPFQLLEATHQTEVTQKLLCSCERYVW